MTFPRYPEYKDSGVEWLGEVPAHWVVGPLRWYATIQGGVAKGKSYSDDTPTIDLPYLRVANVQDGHVDLSSVNTVTVALSEVDRYRLQPGDVLMNEGGDNDKLGRGTVWQGEIADCLHQNHVFAIRPNHHLLPHWLSMFTRSSAARSYFYLYSKQSTNLASISSSNVMSCPLPLPPQEEQRQVLSFLDHETARIDALVKEQQRLIELLKEKRQAVISHAVTKGLDPDVPMKDSGVEWLGEVPAHWDVMKLGMITLDKCDGPFGSALKSEHYSSSGVRVIRLQNVKAGEFGDQDSAYIDEEYYKSIGSRSGVLSGDVLVAGLGDGNNVVGRACVAPEGIAPAMVKADCFRFRLDAFRARPNFMANQLSSGAAFDAGRLASGSTRSRIPLSSMAARFVAVPPPKEQESIEKYLSEAKEKIDALLEEAGHTIELLQERRSALISAAVTGKIDVRGWRADQQPEQSEMLMAAEGRATYG